MRVTEIPANIPLTLIVSSGDNAYTWEVSIAEGVYAEGAILVKPVYFQGTLVRVKSSISINVSLQWTYYGTSWRLNGAEIDTISIDNKKYYKVFDTADAVIVNRRGAYREPIGKFMKITSPNDSFKSFNGEIHDISESGFGFTASTDLSIGELVILHLDYQSISVALLAKIVRKQAKQDLQFYGCSFRTTRVNMGALMARIQREKRSKAAISSNRPVGYRNRSTGLERFVAMQKSLYSTAKHELLDGKKVGNWMSVMFPVLNGATYTDGPVECAINSEQEAKDYAEHVILGARLGELVKIILNYSCQNINEVLTDGDAEILRSCMTLFYLVTGKQEFCDVLERFYDGVCCDNTIASLMTSMQKGPIDDNDIIDA